MKPIIDKKPRGKTGLLIVTAIAAVCAIAFGTYRQRTVEHATVAVLNPGMATPQVMAYPRPDGQEQRATKAPELTGQPTTFTRGQQVKALLKSGLAADSFAAYKLLRQCDVMRRLETIHPLPDDARTKLSVSVACQDIDGGMLTTRYVLLQQAVKAHIEGAAFLAMDETPDGRPYDEIVNDPAYEGWRADAQKNLEEAASRGDAPALSEMAAQAGQPGTPNFKPDVGLAYWTAYTDSVLASNPRYADGPARASFLANTAHLLQAYSQALPPERAAAAIAKGHAMIALNNTGGSQK